MEKSEEEIGEEAVVVQKPFPSVDYPKYKALGRGQLRSQP